MLENKGRYIIDFHDFPTERQDMPELEVDKRIDNFDEVELGLTPEAAQEEAKRCLSCRRCLGCALCLAVCEPKAIVFEQEDEMLELDVDDIIISPEAETYMSFDKGHMGYKLFSNVLSIMEMKKALDSDGPFGGNLMRPFDGEIPGNIAIIVEDDSMADYALKTAENAIDKTDDLSVTIFTSSGATVNTDKNGITVKEPTVKEVKEAEETGNLILSLIDDESENEFDLLVLSGKPEVLPEIKDLKDQIN